MIKSKSNIKTNQDIHSYFLAEAIPCKTKLTIKQFSLSDFCNLMPTVCKLTVCSENSLGHCETLVIAASVKKRRL